MRSKALIFVSISLLILALPSFLSCQKAPLTPEAKAMLSQLELSGDLIVAKKIKGEIPLDPSAQEWNEAKETTISLHSQDSVIPRSPVFRRSKVSVRAFYNNKELGLRLSWSDSTKDEKVAGVEFFQDAVAVGFPVHYGEEAPLPYIGMGNPGRPVNIWQWNASWQADIDKGFQGVEVTYKDMIPDNAPLHFRTGLEAGAALSKEKRTSPIANLVAEGFGTLEPAPSLELMGKGVWKNDQWSVVIKRPLRVGIEMGYSFKRNEGMIPITFAVWDGALKERNGIKGVTRWRFLHLEKEAVPVGYLKSLVIGPLAGSDPARGQQLMTDLGCISCHRTPGTEPVLELGPDLTHAGSIHRPEYLLEAIADPDAVLVPGPGYFDPQTKTSVMPSFGEGLSKKDLHDMVEYLRSQQ